jgi:hypothetical protein
MLAARLVLLGGEARRIAVVSPRSDVDTSGLARELSDAMNANDGASGDRYKVSAGWGLLDDPQTVGELDRLDGLVLAVRRGKTSRADLEECRRLLTAAGVRLITAVLLP